MAKNNLKLVHTLTHTMYRRYSLFPNLPGRKGGREGGREGRKERKEQARRKRKEEEGKEVKNE